MKRETIRERLEYANYNDLFKIGGLVDLMVCELGEHVLFEELLQSLSVDQLKENLQYIAKNYDI